MGQTLDRRFNGNSQEVIDYTRLEGIWKAADKYDVSYTALSAWLEKKTGIPNFGIAPVLDDSDINSISEPQIFQKFADALVAKISNMDTQYKAELAKRDEIIRKLKTELAYYKTAQKAVVVNKLAAVMEALK